MVYCSGRPTVGKHAQSEELRRQMICLLPLHYNYVLIGLLDRTLRLRLFPQNRLIWQVASHINHFSNFCQVETHFVRQPFEIPSVLLSQNIQLKFEVTTRLLSRISTVMMMLMKEFIYYYYLFLLLYKPLCVLPPWSAIHVCSRLLLFYIGGLPHCFCGWETTLHVY